MKVGHPIVRNGFSEERLFVDSNNSTIGSRDTFLENFGAELTEAVYPVLLRHGAVDSWLDLELELWKVLKETVKKWDQDWPSAGVVLVGSINPEKESAPERASS
jgi:hypothetical protein